MFCSFKYHSVVSDSFATLWMVAHQAPLSMEFSRQEYWNGQPFPSPEDLPDSGIKPGSPTSQADTLPSEPSGVDFQCIDCIFCQTYPQGFIQLMLFINVIIFISIYDCCQSIEILLVFVYNILKTCSTHFFSSARL